MEVTNDPFGSGSVVQAESPFAELTNGESESFNVFGEMGGGGHRHSALDEYQAATPHDRDLDDENPFDQFVQSEAHADQLDDEFEDPFERFVHYHEADDHQHESEAELDDRYESDDGFEAEFELDDEYEDQLANPFEFESDDEYEDQLANPFELDDEYEDQLANDFGSEFETEFDDEYEFGLPGDDEEGAGFEYDSEFEGFVAEGLYESEFEGGPSPEPKRIAPFAPQPPSGAHYPVRSTDRRGHIVNYTAVDGSHVGNNQARRFGARRSDGARNHAGIDIYANKGDEVIACQDGRIIAFYGFCCGKNKTTNALVVDHGDIVINYGEVDPKSLSRLSLKKGSQVSAGQVISYIGVNPGGSSMLHLEMYGAGTSRNLKWPAGKEPPPGLLDPTPYLLALAPAPQPKGGGAGGAGSGGRPVLRYGKRGSAVTELQRALNKSGFPTAADGIFGKGTKRAVQEFQQARGLTPDGVVGNQTWQALDIAASQNEGEAGLVPFGLEGEIDASEFTGNADLRAVAEGKVMLAKKGTGGKTPKVSNGEAVKVLQRALLALGYQLPTSGADGFFGKGTDVAVKQYQADRGLKADGLVGKSTILQLFADVSGAASGTDRCGRPVPVLPRMHGASEYWRTVLRFGLAGNHVVPLVDGAETYRAMRRAIETATGPAHYIYFLAWWCDPWVNLDGPGTCLLDLFAAAGSKGVQIRGLVWAPPSVPGTPFGNQSKVNEAAAKALSKLPNTHVQQDAGTPITKSHHQKLMVIKGSEGLIALQGGLDVNADRLHAIPPPKGSYRGDRPSMGWVGASGSGSAGGDGMPQHDVHSMTTGPIVLPLLRAFQRRWWARSGSRAIDSTAPLRGQYCEALPNETGGHFVRIGETFNGVLEHDGKPPVRSREVAAQDIWLRSILGARRSIYIEEQYLTHPCAAEAINRVLPRLDHVIIVIPPSELTDLPAVWKRRREFIAIASRGPHGKKVRVYTPITGKPTKNHKDCRRTGGPWIYLHSKMAIIDDELVLIGSANMNHRGWETDSELVQAFIEQDADRITVAKDLRKRLWAKHLGVPQSAVANAGAAKDLWDTALTRHVCRYDPKGGRDDLGDLLKDSLGLADPTDVQPGDPCHMFLNP